MLEAELATICPMAGLLLPQTYRRNQEQDLHKLRLLLERECAAQVTATMYAHASHPMYSRAVHTATCTSSMHDHQLVSMHKWPPAGLLLNTNACLAVPNSLYTYGCCWAKCMTDMM